MRLRMRREFDRVRANLTANITLKQSRLLCCHAGGHLGVMRSQIGHGVFHLMRSDEMFAKCWLGCEVQTALPTLEAARKGSRTVSPRVCARPSETEKE